MRVARQKAHSAPRVEKNIPIKVFPVKPPFVPYYWDFVKDDIARALDHANGELLLDDIYNYLMTEQMYLWVARREKIVGAAVCEVAEYTRKKVVRVVMLGGEDFDAWGKEGDAAMQEWAQKIGASGVEAFVRKGMAAKLESLGYRQIYVGMVKDGPGIQQQDN